MAQSQLLGDITFRGQATFLDANLNASSVGNSQIKSSEQIDAEKLEQQHRAMYSQEVDTTAADEGRVIHVVRGTTGEVQGFSCGCVIANIGASAVTFDLHNNGASILTGVVTVDSGDAAYAVLTGTIDTAAVVIDDVLEVIIDATVGAGTLGKGAWAALDIFEDAD